MNSACKFSIFWLLAATFAVLNADLPIRILLSIGIVISFLEIATIAINAHESIGDGLICTALIVSLVSFWSLEPRKLALLILIVLASRTIRAKISHAANNHLDISILNFLGIAGGVLLPMVFLGAMMLNGIMGRQYLPFAALGSISILSEVTFTAYKSHYDLELSCDAITGSRSPGATFAKIVNHDFLGNHYGMLDECLPFIASSVFLFFFL